MKNTIFRYLGQMPRSLLFTAVFFGIPLGLLLFGCHQMWEEKARRDKHPTIQMIDSYLSGWKGEQPYLAHLEGVLRIEGIKALHLTSIKDTRKFLGRLNKRFPEVLQFLFIDARGSVINELSNVNPPAHLIQSFFKDYVAAASRSRTSLARNINLYRSFLGPMIGRERDSKIYNKFLPASQRARHSYVYLSQVTANGMFIAFIDRHPKLEERCLADLVRIQQHKKAPWVMELIDLKGSGNPSRNVWGNLADPAQKVLGTLEGGGDPFLAQDGFIWVSVPHLERFRLLLAVPDPTQEFLHLRREALYLVAQTLFPFLFVVVWLTFSRPVPPTLSIRGKLTLLFLYIVGTPLLLMAISGHGFVRDRRVVLENQLYKRQEEFLAAFDRKFPEVNGRFELEIQNLLNPSIHNDNSKLDIRERLSIIRNLYNPILGEIIDANGVSKFQIDTAWEGATRQITTFIKGAATNLLRDINQEPSQEKISAKEQLINMTAEFLGFNVEMIMAGFSQNLGSLKEFGVSKGTIQVMMSPLFNSQKKAEFLCLLAWHNKILESRYLQDHLASFSNLFPHTHMLAVSGDLDQCFPRNSPFLEQARVLSIQVQNQEIPLKRLFETESGDLFLSAINGKHLKKFQLFAFTGSQSIEEEISRSLRGYLWLCMAILALSLLAGRALARQFFVPVGFLENGLKAMKMRQFNHRIPILSNDEFGVLSGTFNEMLEGLEDLEVAKIVQETFFPHEPLVISDWEVFGKSIPASRVGGDYYDYFPIGADRLGILIGDVSGHGVSAALVVAMAKAIISHPRTDFDPRIVLQTIQTVLMKTLKRKKIMTCFFAVFQPSTGLLKACNAGHNFPFLVHGGRVEQLELPGGPLGTRLCKVQQPIERTLDNSSVLLLYTDGFTEARCKDREILGAKRLESALLQELGVCAQDTIERLQAWQARQTDCSPAGPIETGSPTRQTAGTEVTPPEDDITLVVLQRRQS